MDKPLKSELMYRARLSSVTRTTYTTFTLLLPVVFYSPTDMFQKHGYRHNIFAYIKTNCELNKKSEQNKIAINFIFFNPNAHFFPG